MALTEERGSIWTRIHWLMAEEGCSIHLERGEDDRCRLTIDASGEPGGHKGPSWGFLLQGPDDPSLDRKIAMVERYLRRRDGLLRGKPIEP